MNPNETASMIQLLGAGGFGSLMGWYLYYINRHRSGDVKLNDLVTLVGVLGGTAILAVFPARSDLFGAYGIGLFIGFFGYFGMLMLMVAVSKSFTLDWFLDGRSRRPQEPFYIPDEPQRPMGDQQQPPINP